MIYEFSAPLLTLGDRIVDLASKPQEWIARRVDVVTAVDDVAATMTTTLDVSFVNTRLSSLPHLGTNVILPVKTLRRGRDVDATVCDADGHALPQLTRRHERSLVAAGLLQFHPERVGRRPELFEAIRSQLDDVYGPPQEIDLEGPDFEALRIAIDRFRRYHFLLAAVPVSREATLIRVAVSHSFLLPAPKRRRLNAIRNQRQFPIVIDQVDSAESYHFNFFAPPETWISSSDLTRSDRQAQPVPNDSPLIAVVHFFVMHGRGPAPDELPPRITWQSTLTLAPRKRWSGRIVSWLATSVLAALVFSAAWDDADLPILIPVTIVPVSESIVAMLLLGPALLTTLLVREGEHALTKVVLQGYRLRLLLNGSAAYGAALVYGLGLGGLTRWIVLAVLLAVSTFATAAMELGWWSVRRGLDARLKVGHRGPMI